MIFAETDGPGWSGAGVLTVIGTLAGTLLPKFWDYLTKKKEQEPELEARRESVEAKKQKRDQLHDDWATGRIKAWSDKIEAKVSKLEQDNLDCEKKASRLEERCKNLEQICADKDEKMMAMEEELITLRGRVSELENRG